MSLVSGMKNDYEQLQDCMVERNALEETLEKIAKALGKEFGQFYGYVELVERGAQQ